MLLLLILLCTLFIIQEFGKDKKIQVFTENDHVFAKELEGYLHIIPLSQQEVETLILPRVNEVLTVEDVRTLLKKMGFESYAEEWSKEIGLAELSPKKEITRAQWSELYEKILQKLNFSGQVKEKTIQYLGDVKGENRIIADSGNYDCVPEAMTFTYGKSYPVYLYGNYILGRRAEPQDMDERKDADSDAESKQNESTKKHTKAALKSGKTQIEVPEQIRVLVTRGNRGNAMRSRVYVKSAGGLILTSGSHQVTVKAGKTADIAGWMKKWGTKKIRVKPTGEKTLDLTDKAGHKQSGDYRGVFDIYRKNGSLWVVNELPLESYLYGVLPGEMPESYAMEALKAQAVCARTYAVRQIRGKRYKSYHADLNDTTDCQVYRPEEENEKSRKAVEETRGHLLTDGSAPAKIYYFSSSCGFTSGMEVWQSEAVDYLKPVNLLKDSKKEGDFASFIKKKNIRAYDSESLFFRWSATLELGKHSSEIRHALQSYVDQGSKAITVTDYRKHTLKNCEMLGKCKEIKVNSRNRSGAVTELCLNFSKGSVKIYNEYVIRSVLAHAMTDLRNKNGKKVTYIEILPSVFFVAEKEKSGTYRCYGGGLGHGVGMSQTGADGMAEAGMSCREILEKFFPGAVYLS